jgi:hypothetical protein
MRIVSKVNTVRYEGRILQIREQTHCRRFVKTAVRVLDYLDGRLAVFRGPSLLNSYEVDGTLQNETRRETQTSAA